MLPPAVDIPIGAVLVRQVAMSTRAYTIVTSPLPDPISFGNFNSYVGVLNLIEPSQPTAIVNIRLVPSGYGNQLVTWSGTSTTNQPPVVGDLLIFVL